MSKNQTKPINWLSASKLKTVENCSFLYEGKYRLKLPDETNDGAILGGITHDILELLNNKPKYFKYVSKILKSDKLPAPLIKLLKRKLTSQKCSLDNLDKLISFILVALAYDFWMDGGEVKKPETYFELTGKYNTRGYIDAHAIYTDEKGDKYCIIRDYKSQKNKFTNKELDKNIQAYIYLLAAKKLYPQIKIEKSRVEFVLLQFPEDPIQVVQNVTDETLAGIEDYLTYIQGYIDEFGEEHSTSNLAAHQDYPKPEDGFCGKIMCGRASFKGELKKDGLNKLWSCAMKFPYDYFSLYEGEKLVKSAYTEAELLPVKPNQTIKQQHFGGCPAFNKKTVNIESEGFEF